MYGRNQLRPRNAEFARIIKLMNKAKIIIPLILVLILGIFPVEINLYTAGQCVGDVVSCPSGVTQLDAYATMIKMQPWRSELWLMAGKTAFEMGEWTQAEEFLTIAEEKGVLDRQGKQMLAEVYLNIGDIDTGIEQMLMLMQRGQLPAQDYRELYAMLLDQFRVVEAEEVALTWVEEEPRSADAQLFLGLVQLTRDHFSAIKNLEIATALEPELQGFVRDLDLVIVQAHLLDDGAYQQLLIGRELSNQGYPLYAEILVAQAVKMNDQYAEAWAMLGELQQQNGRGDGLAALETAVQLAPESTLVQSLMAVYWQRQGDPTQAMDYYEQLSTRQPEEFRWQVELAKATADAGDIPAGYELILDVRDTFSDEIEVWIETANFCAAYGMDVGTAGLDSAREALSRDQDNVDALTAMGNVFFALSDFDSAQRYYDRGINEEPQNAMLHFMLGRVYLEKENTTLAIYHLELAQALSPSYSTLFAQIERTLEALAP